MAHQNRHIQYPSSPPPTCSSSSNVSSTSCQLLGERYAQIMSEMDKTYGANFLPDRHSNRSRDNQIIAVPMMTSSYGNIFRVTGSLCGEFTGEFPAPWPVTRSLDVFFGLRLNKRLSNGETGDLRRHRAHYVLWHINARNACYCTESTCSLATILTIGA